MTRNRETGAIACNAMPAAFAKDADTIMVTADGKPLRLLKSTRPWQRPWTWSTTRFGRTEHHTKRHSEPRKPTVARLAELGKGHCLYTVCCRHDTKASVSVEPWQ